MAKFKRGFTLIELLVVIAIIGVLATVSIIALSNARAKSRDAKRLGDLKQMQTALEMYFNDKGAYPLSIDNGIFSTSSGSTSTYMYIKPASPTPADNTCSNNDNAYIYSVIDEGVSYTISTCLGGKVGDLNNGPICLSPSGFTNQTCSGKLAINWGDPGEQYLFTPLEAGDGNYVVGGMNGSNSYDFYLAKVDSAGTVIWEHNYGDSGTQIMYAGHPVEKTSDGGYILGGVSANDFYLVKTDSAGNVVAGWPKTYVYSLTQRVYAVRQTSDGGYIMAGTTGYPEDIFIIKTDASGSEQWHKTHDIGGDYHRVRDIIQTADGGYLLTGKASNALGGYLLKLDANGDIAPSGWSQTYTNFKEGKSLLQKADGTYMLAAQANDALYLANIDSVGNIIWENYYGDPDWYDILYSFTRANDGGYLLVGSNDIDGAGNNYDVYMVKVDGAGVEQWHKTFGIAGEDEYLYGVAKTSDGGYVFAGETSANGYDYYFVKTDSQGNTE